LLQLFLTFFRIGAVSFGGGYAMLPMLQRELVETRHWVTEAELADYYAIGQCTPGIIAVNVATFVGYRQKKLLGSLVSTMGFLVPPLILITIIAAFITNFADLQLVKYAFSGIRVCVCVLILNAIIKLWKNAIVGRLALVLFAVIFVLAVFTSVSAPILVLGAGIFGLVLHFVRKEKQK